MNAPEELLLVEDNDELAEVVSIRLTSAGYRIRIAPTLAMARVMIQKFPPQLVILDLLLPDGNGLDLLKEIRGNSEFAELKDIPVLILTGLGALNNVEEGFITGANGYLSKPFEPDQLMNAVRLLVSETSSGSSR